MTLIATRVSNSDLAESNPPTKMAVFAALMLMITIGIINGKLSIATRVAPCEPFEAILETIVRDVDKAVLDRNTVTRNREISCKGFPSTTE